MDTRSFKVVEGQKIIWLLKKKTQKNKTKTLIKLITICAIKMYFQKLIYQEGYDSF